MKLPAAIKDDIYSFTVGFFMGSANVIPGVSGGTMLFIMGAFNRLIGAIRDIICPESWKLLCKGQFRTLFQKIQWRFLLLLTLGVGVSFATLAKAMVYLLEHHKLPTYAFFLGLVGASIVTVSRQIKKWSAGAVIAGAISAATAFAVISLVPLDSSDCWYMIFLCGVICIIAMILPGLSGSFLMLILGQYDRVWNAVGNFARFNTSRDELTMLAILAAGAATGLGAFVHLLDYLLKKFYNCTIAALTGFMVGSLPRLWPFQHDDPSSMILRKGVPEPTRIIYEMPEFSARAGIYLLCAAAGFALVAAVEILAGRKSASTLQKGE